MKAVLWWQIIFHFLHFFHSYKHQSQLINHRLHLRSRLRVKVLGRQKGIGTVTTRFFDSALRAPLRMTIFPDTHRPHESVGNVNVSLPVLDRGVLLQQGTDGDVQETLRSAQGDRTGGVFRQLPLPLVVAVDIRKSQLLPSPQDQQPVVDGLLPARGQPKEPGHEPGTDDSRLLQFHQRLGLSPQNFYLAKILFLGNFAIYS